MKIFAYIYFALFCLLEVIAVIDYFQFPDIQEVKTGAIFAVIGGVFFILSIYFHRKSRG
jgi:drug/metabolite transporter superfamily protein YnfA